jgi:von Willebrand factor type A domain
LHPPRASAAGQSPSTLTRLLTAPPPGAFGPRFQGLTREIHGRFRTKLCGSGMRNVPKRGWLPPGILTCLALAGAALCVAAPGARSAPAAPREPRPPAHRIAVDVRGPIALVQVTRALGPTDDGAGPGELLLDVALPERAALVDLEVSDGGHWRTAEPIDAGRGRDLYLEAVRDRGLQAAREPFDDSAVYRIRVARDGGRAATPVMLRYRFSVIADYADGRQRLRFPAAPERTPAPAEVTVALSGAADVDIAGVRTALGAADGRASAAGRASTRSGWEISWATRGPAAPGEAPSLEAAAATAALSPTESAVAFAVHGRPGRPTAAPPALLLLIDRSSSVGLPGLSAERDLARRLLEALPPATRFDALFFDRATKRLFPMSRPATREAMAALEGEMVPDRLRNGTDLPGALREAAALLRREASAFAPRTLLAIVTDGALPDDQDGAALDRALGTVAGLNVSVAAFAVRAVDDAPVAPGARQALRALAGARGGVLRELRANEIDEAVPAALATLGRGGDVARVRLEAAGEERALADGLAPGEGLAGVTRVAARPASAVSGVAGVVRGQRTHVALRPLPVDPGWLRPHLTGARPTRLATTPALVALVEPVLHPAEPAPEARVTGTMDRMVVRNILSLAYMPRARACYLNRTGATPALRDLSGRVRLAIELVRGEVAAAAIESSTLNHPEVEGCLREGAFAVEVPRALHNDAPVTAILNLVFRPRTPEKKRDADSVLSDEIDLVIEEMHRAERAASPPPVPPPPN